jgi:type I restriction-modification system DNA methylase subunit
VIGLPTATAKFDTFWLGRMPSQEDIVDDLTFTAPPQITVLLGAGGDTFDVILTNPPFGKKQSYRIVRDDGEIDTEREDYDRQEFFVTTLNKQLNFLSIS